MLGINFIKKTCSRLGTNNKSIYPVIAIAAANGICRPTFTMLKKGEDSVNKKYAALREGLTEIIAVPTYWFCGELAAKCGKWITSKAVNKRITKIEKKGGKLSDDAIRAMKEMSVKKGQTGLMLIGVCFAAGFVIPALCSLVVKPVMKKISPPKDTKLDIKEPPIIVNTSFGISQLNKRPIFKNVSNFGMKVGGV